MGLYQHEPPLYVPNLSKPQGAAVDSEGNVTCIACGGKLPLAKADVVGQGYRCAPCSAKAEIQRLATGRSDIADNLSSTERAAMRNRGILSVFGGIALIGGGVALFAIGFVGRLPLALIVLGIATATYGGSQISGSR